VVPWEAETGVFRLKSEHNLAQNNTVLHWARLAIGLFTSTCLQLVFVIYNFITCNINMYIYLHTLLIYNAYKCTKP